MVEVVSNVPVATSDGFTWSGCVLVKMPTLFTNSNAKLFKGSSVDDDASKADMDGPDLVLLSMLALLGSILFL